MFTSQQVQICRKLWVRCPGGSIWPCFRGTRENLAGPRFPWSNLKPPGSLTPSPPPWLHRSDWICPHPHVFYTPPHPKPSPPPPKFYSSLWLWACQGTPSHPFWPSLSPAPPSAPSWLVGGPSWLSWGAPPPHQGQPFPVVSSQCCAPPTHNSHPDPGHARPLLHPQDGPWAKGGLGDGEWAPIPHHPLPFLQLRLTTIAPREGMLLGSSGWV